MQILNIEKSANALFTGATSNFLNLGALIYKKACGGVWIGGTFSAKGEWIRFEPNMVNFVLNFGDGTANIHVSEVRSIQCESGFFTDIIVIQHVRGELKVRCYGAREVTNTLLSYFQQFQR